MKVLVTGGSGFAGREIVRQLAAAGHSVRVLARGSRPVEPGIRFVRGSVLEFATLPAAFADTEAIIHLVGIIGEVGPQTFERVHATGTANAVHAARAAGITRFLHMSALGTRPNAVSRYHQSKWAAEESVRRSGLRWTIFRPSLIYGPEDHFTTLFARIARWSPFLPVMGTGAGLLQPVAVEEVARCFVAALAVPNSIGQTYDLGGPDRLSFTQVLETLTSVMGLRRWQLRIPLTLARLQAAMLEAIFPRLLGSASPLSRDQLTMLQEDNVGDPDPAQRTFGMVSVDFRNGLKRYLGNPKNPVVHPAASMAAEAGPR
ncbi:MAG TPA: complex I NDUFA9 subunit family protein [Verrucomicrobiota bacterium]|nr:complex I NDUFA9 subunit family protein [Verrucomicrobiota bacterium]